MAILSPCVKSCRLDEQSQLCFGCGRHMDEIVNWRKFSDDERATIMEDLPSRLEEHFPLQATAISQ
jgi:predicted Fe-S protein YdhL (DUF1289 family)